MSHFHPIRFGKLIFLESGHCPFSLKQTPICFPRNRGDSIEPELFRMTICQRFARIPQQIFQVSRWTARIWCILKFLPHRSNNIFSKNWVEWLSRFIPNFVARAKTPRYPLHTIKFIPEFDMLFLCWNSQSFHINTGGFKLYYTKKFLNRFIPHVYRARPRHGPWPGSKKVRIWPKIE